MGSDSCVAKLGTGSVSGFVAGTLVGALNAAWQVILHRSWG